METGGAGVVVSGNRERFEARWQTMLDEEVEVNARIKLASIGAVDIEPIQIAGLLPLLDD